MAIGSQRLGALLGLLAAVSFGVSAPLAKLLLAEVSPHLLAGLLYLGAGLGLALYRLARPSTREAPLTRADGPPLLGVVALGGVAGPLLLLVGLTRVSGTTGALLLNLEAPLTICSRPWCSASTSGAAPCSRPAASCWAKRGNSSQEERMDLIGKLLKIPNLPKIKTIIGDREFVGTKWFKYLKNNNIGILFRIRDNQYAKRYNKQYKVSTIIKGNTRKGCQCNGKQYWMDDVQVYIHGFRYKNGEGRIDNLIVASFERETKVSEAYSNRWFIESMFKNFKTNGFNMEDTHITNLDRLETLFGLLTLGYIWRYKCWKNITERKARIIQNIKQRSSKT